MGEEYQAPPSTSGWKFVNRSGSGEGREDNFSSCLSDFSPPDSPLGGLPSAPICNWNVLQEDSGIARSVAAMGPPPPLSQRLPSPSTLIVPPTQLNRATELPPPKYSELNFSQPRTPPPMTPPPNFSELGLEPPSVSSVLGLSDGVDLVPPLDPKSLRRGDSDSLLSDFRPPFGVTNGTASSGATWVVPPGPVAPVPPCHPLERTSEFVPNSNTSDAIAVLTSRISSVLVKRSIAANYDSHYHRAYCTTSTGVEFIIRLYSGKGEYGHGIIVEVQRRAGFSVHFHADCTAVLDAATGKSQLDVFEEEKQYEEEDDAENDIVSNNDASALPMPSLSSSSILLPPPALTKSSSLRYQESSVLPDVVSPPPTLLRNLSATSSFDEVPTPQARKKSSSGFVPSPSRARLMSPSSSSFSIPFMDEQVETSLLTESASTVADDQQFLVADALLRKEQLDSNLLGIKILGALTKYAEDGSRNSTTEAEESSLRSSMKILMAPEGTRIRSIIFSLVEQKKLPTSTLISPLQHEDNSVPPLPSSTSLGESEYLGILRNQALQTLSNALESASRKQGALAYFLEISGDFVLERMIPVLVSDLEAARERPHEALLAATCLLHLIVASAEARVRVEELGCVRVLSDAIRIGKDCHASLAAVSERCANILKSEASKDLPP